MTHELHADSLYAGHYIPDLGRTVQATMSAQMKNNAHLMRLRSLIGEAAPAVIGLTGSYHNLLRMRADVWSPAILPLLLNPQPSTAPS